MPVEGVVEEWEVDLRAPGAEVWSVAALVLQGCALMSGRTWCQMFWGHVYVSGEDGELQEGRPRIDSGPGIAC